MTPTRCSALFASGLWLVASMAVAQEAGSGHRCAALEDDAARLACYDAAFGGPASAPASVAEPTAATAATAAPASSASRAQQEFGLSEADKRAADPAQPEAPSSITAKVADARKRPTGEWVVMLEDGQVWVQAESTTKAIVKAGDEVTIRKAALGSYVLVSANRVAMRVRRSR